MEDLHFLVRQRNEHFENSDRFAEQKREEMAFSCHLAREDTNWCDQGRDTVAQRAQVDGNCSNDSDRFAEQKRKEMAFSCHLARKDTNWCDQGRDTVVPRAQVDGNCSNEVAERKVEEAETATSLVVKEREAPPNDD